MVSFIPWKIPLSGGGERSYRSHPLHLQRSAGVPDLLAHLRHHGSEPVCGEVLPLHQHHHGGSLSHLGGQQQERLHGCPGSHAAGPLAQRQSQLRQRGERLPVAASNRESVILREYVEKVLVVFHKQKYKIFCIFQGHF